MDRLESNRRGDWVDRLSKSVQQHESSRRLSLGQIPRYEILERLGRGGMGAVYRAMDRVLSREVALKVLVDPLGAPAEARGRFLQEARLAATLQHANIVPVFDAGEHEGQVFLAMQLIDGTGLDASGLGLREAVAAVRDAARAVHYAHERGIIHRDLKPSNVMVDRAGRIYVTDFGLARRSDSAARMTMTGTIVGTPIYMPPEQARGNETDARSDVYSLGATLYELASGRPPFSGANELEILKHVLLDEPAFPRRHVPSLPQDLESVIVKAMDKKPAGRYATAAALADDLDRWLRGEPVHAPVRGALYRLRKKIHRHRWRVLATVATIGFLVSSAVVAWAYVKAYRIYRSAMSEPDRIRKLELLSQAATHLDWAREERDSLVAQIAEEERIARIRTAADLANSQKQQELKQTALANAQAIALLERDFMSAIESDLAAAKEILLRLRERNVANILQYEERYTRAEFEDGLASLQKQADRAAVNDFRALFLKLSGDGYRTQKDRDSRLIRPCLDLAAKLGDRPADQLDWLNQAEHRGEKRPSLYEQRGLINLRLDRFVEAWDDYRKYRQLAGATAQPVPAYADLLLHQAGIARQGQRLQEALGHLNEALGINKDHVGALHLRSVLRYQSGGSPLEALEEFHRIVQLDPGRKPAPEHVDAAWKHLRDVAEKTWKTTDPAQQRAERAKAVRATEEVLGPLSGEPAAPLLELARMRLRIGESEKALQDADRAAPSAETHLVRAQIHYLGSRLDRALKEIDEAARTNPKTAVAWYWRGVIREALELPGASEDLKEALRLDFKGSELLARLSRLSAEEGRSDDAIRFATEALNAGALSEEEFLAMPSDRRGATAAQSARRLRADALAYRGRAHYQKSDNDACRADCTAALELDPDHVDGLYHRGLALYRLNKTDDAVRDFDRLIQINPRDFLAYAARGTASWNKKNEAAREDYRKALEHAPQNWKQRQALEELLKK